MKCASNMKQATQMNQSEEDLKLMKEQVKMKECFVSLDRVDLGIMNSSASRPQQKKRRRESSDSSNQDQEDNLINEDENY